MDEIMLSLAHYLQATSDSIVVVLMTAELYGAGNDSGATVSVKKKIQTVQKRKARAAVPAPG